MNPIYTNVSQYRNQILLRGYDERGRRVQKKVNHKPYLFVPLNGTAKDEGYRGLIDKEPLAKVDFDSINDAREFVKQYDDVGSMPIHGLQKWIYPFINDTYPGLSLEVDYSLIKIGYLDIECRSNDGFPKPEKALQEITAITISDGSLYHVFGCGEYKTKDYNTTYHQFETEIEMLEAFVRFFRTMDFDVITGWNVEGFDIPYLYNRIANLISEEEADKLSPWNVTRKRKFFDRNGRENETVDLEGIAVLDFFQLYMKFSTSGKQESYKLGYIAQVELGETKVDFRSEGYTDLEDLYQRNFDLYVDYNVKDVRLVIRLEDKLKFLQQAMAIAYDAKINFSDATTSVLLWDVIIHNNLMEEKIIVPPATCGSKMGQVRGAYVKEPAVGVYKWLVSFDLASLYPHLIMQYNISPETFRGMANCESEDILAQNKKWKIAIEFCIENNYTLAGNGAMFTREFKGILPKLMESYYEDRKKFKKLQLTAESGLQNEPGNKALAVKVIQYKNMQMAKKIALNAAYGALLNQYFRYFNTDLGEAVTMSGQVGILWISRELNDYMVKLTGVKKDYVIANDTDSCYLSMIDLVNLRYPDGLPEYRPTIVDFLDKICELKFQPFIEDRYVELLGVVNGLEQKMKMKREAIAEAAIWTGGKHYIMMVWNNEGVAYKNKDTGEFEPHFKMIGIEAVSSRTPTLCRGAIEQAAKLILAEDQTGLIKFVEDFREKFKEAAMSDPSLIARNSGIQNLDKYHLDGKGVPMHVKAALVHNSIIKKHKWENKYQKIQTGDKIKYISLKMPNPIHYPTIAFIDESIMTELGVNKYIDVEAQLTIGFINAITTIANAANMNIEEKSSLVDFFC